MHRPDQRSVDAIFLVAITSPVGEVVEEPERICERLKRRIALADFSELPVSCKCTNRTHEALAESPPLGAQ